MNRERALRRKLAELMQADLPPLTGLQLLALQEQHLGHSRGPGAVREGDRAVYGGRPAAAESRWPPVRVLMTGVPMVSGAERVLEIVERQRRPASSPWRTAPG